MCGSSARLTHTQPVHTHSPGLQVPLPRCTASTDCHEPGFSPDVLTHTEARTCGVIPCVCSPNYCKGLGAVRAPSTQLMRLVEPIYAAWCITHTVLYLLPPLFTDVRPLEHRRMHVLGRVLCLLHLTVATCDRCRFFRASRPQQATPPLCVQSPEYRSLTSLPARKAQLHLFHRNSSYPSSTRPASRRGGQ